MSPDLTYRIFARAQFESFATEHLGNAAIARLGARLTQNLYGWRITGQYKNRYDFDGIYRDLAFTSNDIMGSVGRDFQFGNVTLSPLALLTYRFSDLAEARRWRFDALLGIEVKLDPKWSIVSTPFIEAFWFTDGLNAGRQDQIEAAAVAVICFEWLQRPENVIAGHIKWSGYRTGPKPTIRIEHHKTGEIVDHPLEEGDDKFYEEAEEVMSHLKRLGTPMILYEVEEGKAKPFGFRTMQHNVQRMRVKLGLPSHFTFDACRHGGMTELEEAELTDGQGRALSAHRTQQSYIGYAKRTEKRVLAATRKRHAHRLANEMATDVRNEQQKTVQNEAPEQSAIIK